MKYIVLLGDGMADYPIESLGGRTPLAAARTPNMDLVARKGRAGLVRTVPKGMPPGSDVANLAVLGYNPSEYYTGRGPFEAAAMGVHLEKDDIAFRCNLVTVNSGVMADYSAGHITTKEGTDLISSLKALENNARFYPGVSYRHLLVLKNGASEHSKCTPPHDISGKPIGSYLPEGRDSSLLKDLMDASVPLLAKHPVNMQRIAKGDRPANMIWPWGQGRAPSLPIFKDKYGLTGAVISAVDLIRGIGKYAGLEVIDVPGATGYLDTNYDGKVAAALEALNRLDFVFLHVEAPDEAGHEGDLDKKIQAIEDFDERIVGPVFRGLKDASYDWRICILPDHPTPLALKTHSSEPVPFAIMGKSIELDNVERFDELAAKEKDYEIVEGYKLMSILIE
jgi:2,3-bisphosphoglycerate-independent phosphoglycerate mutase